jgi:hypothetical protein
MENLWNIKEYEQLGPNCPVIPVKLPMHKKLLLFFFRFGICPLCITSSVIYSGIKFFKRQKTA